jgi:hypothetical protein
MQLQRKLHGLKQQAMAMGIGLLCAHCADRIEPLISIDGLDLLVLSILTTLNVVLWIHFKSLKIALGGSVLAIHFHLYCSNCFVRQIALAFMIAGGIMSFCYEIRHRKSKDQT